jgi:hypothetical protein
MRKSVRPVVVMLTIGVGLTVASCDKSPTRPSNLAVAGGGPAPVVVTRIEVSGPASVDPGGSAQLTARAIKSDGSAEDVTSQAQWSTSNVGVLQVGSGGVVTARVRGQALVTARHASRSGSLDILVLPSGTFKLTGQISEGGLPLEGVALSVIGGTGEGLTTVTNVNGTYALYGVAGRVRLHAKKEGFKNQVEEIDVAGNRELNFEMRFDGERDDLSGTYALQIEARGCAALPEVARKRTYTASVEQQGGRLSVRLSGADFIVFNGRGDHFNGSVNHDGSVTFSISNWFYYYYYWYSTSEYDLVERLNADNAFVIAGTVNAKATSTGIAGDLQGMVAVTQGVVAPFNRLASSCVSSSHHFEMRRQ